MLDGSQSKDCTTVSAFPVFNDCKTDHKSSIVLISCTEQRGRRFAYVRLGLIYSVDAKARRAWKAQGDLPTR